MLCLLLTAIPLWLYDFRYLRVYKRLSDGPGKQLRAVDKQRLVTKLIGFYTTLLIILVLYHIIPIFRHSFFAPFFEYLYVFILGVILFSFFYFSAVDRRQKDPYDEYWHMGCLLTGRFKKIDGLILKEHALNWFIKAFFTPIVIGVLVKNVNHLFLFTWESGPESFLNIFKFLMVLFYIIDVIFGVLGYILTSRLLDTHIRSTEPTLLGWLVCLACYYPFATYFGIGLLEYDDGFAWNHWFAFTPFFYYFYGIVILFLSGVYALSTVAFGYRFSNLTFRGLITSGPYRYTKHPAYLGKVLAWWLIYVPFFSTEGPWIAVKNSLFLVIISLVYYLRARTEENHLSNYPEYVKYAEWINTHGVFKSLTKHFPALKYSKEKCERWKSIVWFKKSG